MKYKNILFFLLIILCFFQTSYSIEETTNTDPVLKTLILDIPKQGSLPNKGYSYFHLTIPDNVTNVANYLLVTLKADEQEDMLDNIVSDPNLYISTRTKLPNAIHNEWSSQKYGDEIISIEKKSLRAYKDYYLSVYCEKKCNYILKAKLYVEYEMDDDGLYEITLNPYEAIKISFESRDEFDSLIVNVVGGGMRQFNAFLAKEHPSSSNTIPSEPIFINGRYFIIKKGDKYYAPNYQYQLLIENSNFKQKLTLWLEYDNEAVEIEELTPIYNSASPDLPNCYFFHVDEPELQKNIVISTTVFSGSGILKIGGWKQVTQKIENTKDEIPILTDKTIILTKKEFESYGKHDEDELNLCFLANEETSYLLKIYYEENTEKAQKLNYLLPGIRSESYLPANNVTRYELNFFDYYRDIYVDMKIKKGKPNLYLFYPDVNTQYIDNKTLWMLKKNHSLINSTKLSYNTYRVTLEKEYNKAIYINDQKIFAIIECPGNSECRYEIQYDHIGNPVSMKPKVIYSNVITKDEKDRYYIPILDEDVKNIGIVLNQNTGKSKLELLFFVTPSQKEISINKINQNHIEISAKELGWDNLRGTFHLQVTGLSYASYNLYYYTFSENTSDELDHKVIQMQLTKGQIFSDYILSDNHFRVYSYENHNNKDLFIFLTEIDYDILTIYVFKDLDDYYYEDDEVQGYLYSSEYDNFIYISKNDANYIADGTYYIMVYRKTYDSVDKDSPMYKKYRNITEYNLAIVDEDTSISLKEGVEFENKITKHHTEQKYFYNHVKNNETLYITVTTPFSKAKISIKIGGEEYLNNKYIVDYFHLEIDYLDINRLCPSSKSCGIDIKIGRTEQSDVDFNIIILCTSNVNSPVLLKSGIPTKKTIVNNQQQYYIVDTPFTPNFDTIINVAFTYGNGVVYAKRFPYNKDISTSDFPNEKGYDYKVVSPLNNNVHTIIINNQDVKRSDPFKLLITVQGAFKPFLKNKYEYYISLSNVIDELIINKNYKLFVSQGEVKYFHFKIKKPIKKLHLSMTNKKSDGNLYLGYGQKIDKSQFQWRSRGAYNEYLDISADDQYFIERNINSLEGDYYLAIDVAESCFFNLFISDREINFLTLETYEPTPCSCEKPKDVCYFRYELVNSEYVTYPPYQSLIFYTEFTYGGGNMFAKLYPNGNNQELLENLPSNVIFDYKTMKDYLKIAIRRNERNYNAESVIVLGVQCTEKSLFDINVKKLSSYDEMQNGGDLVYLDIGRDNVYYISAKLGLPIKFLLSSDLDSDIRFEAKAYEGSGKVKVFIGDPMSKRATGQHIGGHKHLLDFAVDERDDNYWGVLSQKDTYNHNVYFEVTAVEDCLFFIHLNYVQKEILIPMNKEIVAEFNSNRFIIAYIKLLPEYDEVILNINNDNYNGDGTIYVYEKTNRVFNADLEKATKYSFPSPNNYDTKAELNPLTNTLTLKIKNIPKELRESEFKPLAVISITTDDIYRTSVTMTAHPNIDHIERIFPEQKTYLFSSLNSINVDKTIFTLSKQNQEDDFFYIELSSCKGAFDYSISEVLGRDDKRSLNHDVEYKRGKVTMTINTTSIDQFYLSVWGTGVDQILFDKEHQGVDFLLYYYTTKSKDYLLNKIDSSLSFTTNGKDTVYINIPQLKSIDYQGNEKVINNIEYSIIISDNFKEFQYMDSICYLSNKYKEIQSGGKNITKYNIKNKGKNAVEISGLNMKTFYFANILASNTKTGEIFTFDPLEFVIREKIRYNSFLVVLLIIVVCILGGVGFYFYKKYRITRNAILYESNDIINMTKLPKSINELQEMEIKSEKKSKEKYNSLTEDSGMI